MIAKALEANGAIVYIVSRRLDVLETSANEHSVRRSRPPLNLVTDTLTLGLCVSIAPRKPNPRPGRRHLPRVHEGRGRDDP